MVRVPPLETKTAKVKTKTRQDFRVQLKEMFQSHGEKLSRYYSSDKDVNASQSLVVYYGNTKELQECLGEKR
jgi:hypothetical protein